MGPKTLDPEARQLSGDERTITVGYGHRNQKSARAQLWSKYKELDLTEGKFGGDDPWVNYFSWAWGNKNCGALLLALFPALGIYKDYKVSTLLKDLVAGLIVGASSVPLGFAHALIAGVSPKVGLFTCFVPCLVYGVFASSKHLSHGTDATIALMTQGVVNQYDESERDQISQIVALIIGITLVILGVLRIDYIIHYISRPILSGFISGSTVLVILSQLKYLVGTNYDSSVFGCVNFVKLWIHITEGRWITFGASCIMLSILVLAAYSKSKLLDRRMDEGPILCRFVLGVLTSMPLVVSTVATIINWVMHTRSSNHDYHLNAIGEKTELPSPGIGGTEEAVVDLIQEIVPQAIIIALMSYISSMSMALGYASGKYEVSGMQELLAMGYASMIGAWFGCMPPSSGLSRTAISTSAGQQTQLTSVISFGFLALILGTMNKFFIYMPYCALASIVVVSSTVLFDYTTPIWLYRIGAMEDLAAYMFALISTVALGPTYGLFLSVGCSLLMIIQRISLPRMTVLAKQATDDEQFMALEQQGSVMFDGVVVINVVDSLFFGNAGRFKNNIHHIIADAKKVDKKVHVIVLDMESVISLDSTGLTTLQELNLLLLQQDVTLLLAGLQKQVFKFVTLSGITRGFQQHLHLNTPVDIIIKSAQQIAHTKHATVDQDIEVDSRHEDMQNPVRARLSHQELSLAPKQDPAPPEHTMLEQPAENHSMI
eukprot:TRINITY_DN4933_c0_g1_i16.p1 TRINITY_DN4933_c0_g1~~TRINITY_DN4933_c0_g1_i16.p1  ORF type:complete len:715 (-),score=127.21 TRINITY_DN4933_c0_g1_i16:291-2435(-)